VGAATCTFQDIGGSFNCLNIARGGNAPLGGVDLPLRVCKALCPIWDDFWGPWAEWGNTSETPKLQVQAPHLSSSPTSLHHPKANNALVNHPICAHAITKRRGVRTVVMAGPIGGPPSSSMVIFASSSSSSSTFHSHTDTSVLLSCRDGPQKLTGFVKRGRPRKGQPSRVSPFTPLPLT
jgi:hypothetical protein